MSSEVAIRVSNLSKCYQVYENPRDRLKQFVIPRLMSAAGAEPSSYFREFWALRDVSFEIRRGETVGIVGRNGSGKSTLLQMICGTLTPTTGYVETHGRIAALLELGSGFNPDFTGRENVYLNCAINGFSRSETDERLDDILAFADIGSYIDQPLKTYSSGMFVRLAFAVQAYLNPDILVVDEALAVGDALFQKRCYERMDGLISQGTTLLFVSHDEESVRTLTQRAILLRDGEMSVDGSSAEVLLEYRRQLHEQEKAYLAALAKSAADRSAAESVRPPAPAPQAASGRSADRFSFGDLEAEVCQVRVLNDLGEEQQAFAPTDRVRIEVRCVAHRPLNRLNVALRLRNKEGVKIYSWGTLNQDMAILAGVASGPLFWQRDFSAGEEFVVSFGFVCGLGTNLYEIQAAITQEGKPYYAEQRMLHWRDEAAFITVASRQREYHFGGVADLKMAATVSSQATQGP